MKKGAGYTLIEVLTTIGIFLLISGSVTGLFLSSVMIQKKVLSTQKLFDNVSYTLEYMSRALRMAKKDDIGGINCLMGNKVNYETTTSRTLAGQTYDGPGIKFRNYKNECQEFFLDNNDARLKESKNGAAPLPLTPGDFEVVTSTFKVQGASQPHDDYLQPRVIIFLEIETTGQKPESKAKIQIQTTISQRDLDVEE